MKVCLVGRYFNLKDAGIGRYSMTVRDELRKRGFGVVTVSEDDLDWISRKRFILGKYFVYTMFAVRGMIPKDCTVYHAMHVLEANWLPYGEKPTVVTVHDLIPVLYTHTLKTHYANNPINTIISKKVFDFSLKRAQRADRVIAISNQVKEELLSYAKYDPEKIVVIPNGIPDYLQPQEKEDDVPRVGMLSYLDPRKRFDLLIEAYKQSKHEGELWIGGDTMDVQYKQHLLQLAGNDPRIKFLGFVPVGKEGWFYSQLDAMIFTSASEGYGLPIVEALACGKPVVTLEDAIIPEEVKEHTYVVSKKDLPAVIENPPRVKKKDVEWAQKHRWSVVVDQIVEVYEDVIQGS